VEVFLIEHGFRSFEVKILVDANKSHFVVKVMSDGGLKSGKVLIK